jgi:hypothetical protein
MAVFPFSYDIEGFDALFSKKNFTAVTFPLYADSILLMGYPQMSSLIANLPSSTRVYMLFSILSETKRFFSEGIKSII